ncbi:MAG: hypothetical protein EHM45_24830, partial [Desulfobacteraceae bacterium]
MTEAYAHNREYLLDELRRIDLLLQQHIRAMQSLWRKKAESQWPGMYISDEEVNRILEQGAEPEPDSAGHPSAREAELEALRAWSEKIREREQES